MQSYQQGGAQSCLRGEQQLTQTQTLPFNLQDIHKELKTAKQFYSYGNDAKRDDAVAASPKISSINFIR